MQDIYFSQDIADALPYRQEANERVVLFAQGKQIRVDKKGIPITFQDETPFAVHTWSKKNKLSYLVSTHSLVTLLDNISSSGKVFCFADYDIGTRKRIHYRDGETVYTTFCKGNEHGPLVQRQPLGEEGIHYSKYGNNVTILQRMPNMHFLEGERIHYPEDPKIDSACLQDDIIHIYTHLQEFEKGKLLEWKKEYQYKFGTFALLDIIEHEKRK